MSAKLIDIRCSCGKLLGRVQEGAAHEHKCPRCKEFTKQRPEDFYPTVDAIVKLERRSP